MNVYSKKLDNLSSFGIANKKNLFFDKEILIMEVIDI